MTALRWLTALWGATLGMLPIAATALSPPTSALDVHVETGQLHGTLTESGARAWFGIPYAAPPAGARRWREPAPATRWDGIRDARQPGPPCPQASTTATGATVIVGSEDCLTLNVFHPPGAIDRALPVMVWIHGGGQMFGTGATYDGSRLAMSQNVVVVTINYRLGPLGWFHHPAITGTGNKRTTGQFALLDAIAALKWVRRNIAAFGGDAANVTVFGESAGAQNVYGLLLAPAAAGLFQQAIAESGGFWNMHLDQAINDRDARVPGTPLSAREVVKALRKAPSHAGPPPSGNSNVALARWLRALSPAELLAPYVGAPHAEYDLPSIVYDDVLIPAKDHRSLLREGRYNRVPLLIGGNRDEQKAYQWSDPAFVEQIDGRLTIRDKAHYETVNRLYSDWWNFSAVDDLLPRLHSPVYAYRFEWDDEPTSPNDLKALYGSAHGLELAFVFGDFRWGFIHDELPDQDSASSARSPLQGIFSDANAASRQRVSSAMMAYWGEFARTGTPGRGGRDDLPLWAEWSTGHRKIVFGNDGLSWDQTLVKEENLRERLQSSRDLSVEEKCNVLLDNTMYPRYPLQALTDKGCHW